MSSEVQFDEKRRRVVRGLLVATVRKDTAQPRKRRMFAIGLITAGSLALGTGAFATAGQLGWIALPCTSQEACSPSYAPVPSWPVNDSGQTYGVQGDSPVAPVLVRVMATNGKEGYAFSMELQGPQPTSPEDAAKNFSTPRPNRQVPVYLSDGKTQIGVFQAG
ncbi:hypothetical protein [Arthrobacter sp. UYCu712]|uniref:hypothetical protein n=1 Tax=Arthrobacter sp. UYCu712 TaxID=3156340 RepID=UPI0033967241